MIAELIVGYFVLYGVAWVLSKDPIGNWQEKNTLKKLRAEDLYTCRDCYYYRKYKIKGVPYDICADAGHAWQFKDSFKLPVINPNGYCDDFFPLEKNCGKYSLKHSLQDAKERKWTGGGHCLIKDKSGKIIYSSYAEYKREIDSINEYRAANNLPLYEPGRPINNNPIRSNSASSPRQSEQNDSYGWSEAIDFYNSQMDDNYRRSFEFVDYSGAYRHWGDSFIDGKGGWRSWGEGFYDGDGNWINWGDDFKDGNGDWRKFGEGFYDTNGNWVRGR